MHLVENLHISLESCLRPYVWCIIFFGVYFVLCFLKLHGSAAWYWFLDALNIMYIVLFLKATPLCNVISHRLLNIPRSCFLYARVEEELLQLTGLCVKSRKPLYLLQRNI